MNMQPLWLALDRVLYLRLDPNPENWSSQIAPVIRLLNDLRGKPATHVVLDAHQMHHARQHGTTIAEALHPLVNHRQVNWIVAITTNLTAQALFNRIASQNQARWRNMGSLSAATQYLQEQDRLLPILPSDLRGLKQASTR